MIFLKNKNFICCLFVKEQCLYLLEGTDQLINVNTDIDTDTDIDTRGMFTLATSEVLPTSSLNIPTLNLLGRIPPR